MDLTPDRCLKEVPSKHTLLHKLGLLRTNKSTNYTKLVNHSSISHSGETRNSVGGSTDEVLENGESRTANAGTRANTQAYGVFT